MKLRNKKTGESFNIDTLPKDVKLAIEVGATYFWYNYELYQPAEPLIKNEKIRKEVRAWAEIHDIKKVFYCEYSWKNNTAWMEDAEDDKSMVKGESASIDIPPIIELKNREYYTIAELCGEEEE